MTRKVQKSVYVPIELAEELEECDNQSAVVVEGLREVLGQ